MDVASKKVPASNFSMQSQDADLRVIPRKTSSGERISGAYNIVALPRDIDHMGHVNNAVYLTWVQDVIVKYWSSTAANDEMERYIWIAIKHEIAYRRPAFLGDQINATVTATGFRGARAMFDTTIQRGNLLLAEVKSVWCCLAVATHRPVRISSDLVRRLTLCKESHINHCPND